MRTYGLIISSRQFDGFVNCSSLAVCGLLIIIWCLVTGIRMTAAQVERSKDSENRNERSEIPSESEARQQALEHYRRGQQYFENGLLIDKAIAEYHTALSIDPTIGELHCELAAVYYAKGDFDAAIRHYQQGLEFHPPITTPGIAHLGLGMIHFDKGDLAEAQQAYQQAAQRLPERVEVFVGLGNVYAKQGYFDQAESAYQRAIELDPNAAEAYQGLGHAYAMQNKLETSVQVYEKAIQLQPYHAASYYDMAQIAVKRGERDKAHALMSQYQELKGYEAEVRQLQGESRKHPENPAPHLALAQLHLKHGNLDAAISAYEVVTYLAPQFGVAYKNLGLIYTEQKQYALALAAFQKALALEPQDVAVHLGLGQLYATQGELNLARKTLEGAIELASESDATYLLLGQVYSQQGNPNATVAVYKKWVSQKPQSPQAWSSLGLARLSQQDIDEAITCFQKAIELDEHLASAYNNLAFLYADTGRAPARAVKLAKKAVELKPKATYLDTLAWAYYKNGQYPEARVAIQRALELKPDSEAFFKRLRLIETAEASNTNSNSKGY